MAMPSIGEQLLNNIRIVYGGVRIGIELLAEHIDEVINGGLMIVRLPTGYGKSSLSPLLAAAINNYGYEYGIGRVIHVLPLRSIVQDLYQTTKYLYGKYGSELGIKEDDAAYQASVMIDEGRKDELFLSPLIYTTLDSYVLNFTKVTPYRTRHASFEAARASIYTALTIFDETHLFAEVDASRAYTSLVTISRSLLRARLPIIVMTATIPDSLVNKLITNTSPGKCVILTMDNSRNNITEDDFRGCRNIAFPDKDWGSTTKLTHEVLTVKGDGVDEVVERVNQYLKDGLSVLVVRNTVKLAIKTYRRLREGIKGRVLLLHGRLTHGDRNKVVQEITEARTRGGKAGREGGESREPHVLVATQVIEAGVNVSYGALITDAAPLAQLVQRVGRICRFNECDNDGSTRIYILYSDNEEYRNEAINVYDPSLVKRTIASLQHSKELDWRAPRSDDPKSYFNLLNVVYQDYYNNLKVDHDIENSLENIDELVTIHREDATNYLKKLCNFVRETQMITLITKYEECQGKEGKEVLKCIEENSVNVDLEYLNRKINHTPLYTNLLKIRGNQASILIAILQEEKIQIEEVEVPLNKIIYNSVINCKKLYDLNNYVMAKAPKNLDKERTAVIPLGFLIKNNAYIQGEGFEADISG
ncbi:CRISPR-associated helicase Cas3' [Vulcanisaeta sp. SCGC AB-777_J10]|nr:CRISPR-associated helicase Cas3' [Vulcanisaeta sp. SCGC AB-777_J10]